MRLLKAAHGTGTETIVRFPATLFVMTETNLYGNGAPAALAAPRNDPGLPQIEAPVVEEVDLAALTDGQTSLGLPHRRRRDDGSDEAVGPIPVTELAQSTGLPTPVEEDVRRGQPGPARGARRSDLRRDLRCRLRLEARDGRAAQGRAPEPQPCLHVGLGQAGGAGCRSGHRSHPGSSPRPPVPGLSAASADAPRPRPSDTGESLVVPGLEPDDHECAQLPAQANAVRAPWMSSAGDAAPDEPVELMVVPQLVNDDDSWEAQEAENREAQNVAAAAALVADDEAARGEAAPAQEEAPAWEPTAAWDAEPVEEPAAEAPAWEAPAEAEASSTRRPCRRGRRRRGSRTGKRLSPRPPPGRHPSRRLQPGTTSTVAPETPVWDSSVAAAEPPAWEGPVAAEATEA